MTEQGAPPSSSNCHCHSPRKRGIQYAAASRINHKCLGVLDRPVEPGDDSECVACACHRLVIASASEAIQNPSAEGFWIASSQGLLAMTEPGARRRSPIRMCVADTPSPSRGGFRPSFASSLHPRDPRGRREGRVPAGTHGPLRETHTQRRPHSSIQVKPNTRPSLRSGLTAYAALSREPSSFWPPSPQRKSPAPRRLTRMSHPPGLEQRRPGPHGFAVRTVRYSQQFFQPCRRSRKLTGETNLTAPLVRTKASGSRRAIRPARSFRARRCRVHRSPAPRSSRHMIAPQG